jgi:uncharacterized protein (TIGR02646 family)
VRYIPLHDQIPDAAWVAKAKAILNQLKAASNADARKKIIDDNKTVWGELKEWLLSLSHQKCWFSEAKDCFNHWHVEHFRPKKSAKDRDGTEHERYWWLSFDWHNFRICGDVGNSKKGTFFPLRPGCVRVGPTGDIRFEDPLLLDPADEDDPSLLSFDLLGRAIPAPYVDDEWEKARVEYSIERYKLDFSALEDQRKVVWKECWTRIEEYRRELSTYHADKNNGIARDRFKQAAKEVRKMIGAEKQFSAVAKACVLNTGDRRVVRLLQSS